MRKRWNLLAILTLILSLFVTGCGKDDIAQTTAANSGQDKVTIGIGYQIPTAQTWGVLIVKNKHLFEKHLKAAAPDKDFEIEWSNSPSGPPLTNNMVAGKLQIALMGDMPILINGEQGQKAKNYQSVFLAFDGKGKSGHNQAIMAPENSTLTIDDLKGKTVSTPLGSSAHRMLLEALDKRGITDQVNIVNQDVTVGMTNIEQDKIDAHATWEPYPSLILSKKTGKVLLDGSDTGVDYLDGVVADRKWVEANPEYTVAFLKALLEAHEFIRQNPEEAAQIFAEETQYPLEVTKAIVKNVRFDSVIYRKDINTLAGSRDFLKKIDKLKEIDLDKFVDDSYLKKAFSELKKEYPSDQELQGEWLPLK
ncbi:ABC transporter substrate-binding protein [Selenomonas caprae]|uniref:ABC transporter substrate-binding protein n=1 Tax=Selenomonas caprae TaxID=2606905 RepID=A0A5D6WMF5_9FIRM|nr:ABC transporter substrate-binding protein [Selenomonas caprae]TYZ29761.1 ABC transporter substrate-binding protein [Selenomonas caprae]